MRPIFYIQIPFICIYCCELWEKVFLKDLSKLYRIHVLLNDTFFSILESVFQISLLQYITSISNILTYFKSKTWLLCKPLSPFHCDRVENIWLKNLWFSKFAWFVKKYWNLHVPSKKKCFVVVTQKEYGF